MWTLVLVATLVRVKATRTVTNLMLKRKVFSAVSVVRRIVRMASCTCVMMEVNAIIFNAPVVFAM